MNLANFSGPQISTKLRQLAVDLSRVAFLPLPITQYPRSIHQTFPTIAPEQCLLARNGQSIAKRLLPRRVNWPAFITSRDDMAERGTHDPDDDQFKACFGFTSCGSYLIRGVLPTFRPCWSVQISVFQTRTWMTVGSNQNLSPDAFGLHGPEDPFCIACSLTPSKLFRYVILWSIAIDEDYITLLYESRGSTPYASIQACKPPDWEELTFSNRDVRLVLHQNGDGILIWDKSRLRIWSSISSRSSVRKLDNIVAADFGFNPNLEAVICLDANGLFYVVDFRGRILHTLVLKEAQGPSRAFIDRTTRVILLTLLSSNTDSEFSTIRFSDERHPSSALGTADVKRFSGWMAARKLDYFIWFCQTTRRLVVGNETIFAHPQKPQCILQYTPTGGFIVFEDFNEDEVNASIDFTNTGPRIQ